MLTARECNAGMLVISSLLSPRARRMSDTVKRSAKSRMVYVSLNEVYLRSFELNKFADGRLV